MKILILLPSLFLLLFTRCSTPEKQTEINLFQEVSTLSFIEGKPQYLASPFVTAGDRVYIVGHQDGSFPDLGWHVAGEMGGIWDHPIKLMDGFTASIKIQDSDHSFCLDKAAFEVAKPEDIVALYRDRGFELERLRTCYGRHGCNEFLFRHK